MIFQQLHEVNQLFRFIIVWFVILFFGITIKTKAQNTSTDNSAQEEDYYKIRTVPKPVGGSPFEVSGIDLQPSGDLIVTTRYGEIWLIEDPYMAESVSPSFTKIASGLHTPLGISSKNGKYYVAQRTELTELSDTDGDDIIDRFRTFCTFTKSGNYCEYVHGPIVLPDGSFWVNMNLAHNWQTLVPFYYMMDSHAPWSGWAMIITPQGELVPYASGLRSPAGMGIGSNGTMYYSENQGDWVGTGYVTTVEEGDFFGDPASLKDVSIPEEYKSEFNLRPSDIPDMDSLMLHEAAKLIPELKMPSVRLPHGVMGTSLSWILEDTTGGEFGPFEGQLFVADQGQSKIMRVFLEEVKGEMQGAAFQFREGFQSGIIRSSWGIDGSMFVGMSDRGWSALGPESDGLQQVVWTGKVPFEIKAIRAKPDGFQLEFTKPVDSTTVRVENSYQISSFDYLYHKKYGSPIVDESTSQIKGAILSDDRMHIRLVLSEPLRAGYVYQIAANGIKSEEGQSVLHPEAYYSLNQIPEGEKANISPSNTVIQDHTDPKPTSPSTISTGEQQQQMKNATTIPASWQSGPDQVVTINAAPGMKFDKTNFKVSAGSKIKLVFNNPTDLLHNLLIVQPGTIEPVAKKALDMGLQGPKKDYVPETENVLFHTSLIDIEESESIYFKAPEQPNKYPYVCTFPGHWQTMQGIMTVVP
ncbi:plastocyanin/azurin family copper-binding protein [Halalkalibaculum sp. DA3122]|uniref:plastocyanin/azurin family copper-binding protein n=1 Tax=Halalkalibaculum sp. DA3122 TaxID=3373607 RepID=UPI00375413D1